MRDELGSYYFAQAGDNTTRVYVRRGENGEIEFRLWHKDYPHVWEKHGWLSRDVIARAAAMYRETRDEDADPLKIYDVAIAKNLLAEEDED